MPFKNSISGLDDSNNTGDGVFIFRRPNPDIQDSGKPVKYKLRDGIKLIRIPKQTFTTRLNDGMEF